MSPTVKNSRKNRIQKKFLTRVCNIVIGFFLFCSFLIIYKLHKRIYLTAWIYRSQTYNRCCYCYIRAHKLAEKEKRLSSHPSLKPCTIFSFLSAIKDYQQTSIQLMCDIYLTIPQDIDRQLSYRCWHGKWVLIHNLLLVLWLRIIRPRQLVWKVENKISCNIIDLKLC